MRFRTWSAMGKGAGERTVLAVELSVGEDLGGGESVVGIDVVDAEESFGRLGMRTGGHGAAVGAA